jgi:subtilase family serine protease
MSASNQKSLAVARTFYEAVKQGNAEGITFAAASGAFYDESAAIRSG